MQEMLGPRPPMPWSIEWTSFHCTKALSVWESLQHHCRYAMEAAARVDEAPMHRPALKCKAG